MKFVIGAIIALAALAAPPEVEAQNLIADLLRLRGGGDPCTSRAGSGPPEGTVAGRTCDVYVDNASGRVFMKISSAPGTTTGWFQLLGPSAVTCDDFATCAAGAAALSWDYLTFEQRLRTDPEKRLRSYLDANGARLQSYDGSGYRPLWLQASPLIVAGGGLHVGVGGGASDPGLGNVNLTGFIGAPGFVSQTDEWRIDDEGGADFRYVYTDELHAKAFIADLEQALAGGQIISKSVALVGAVFTVPAAGDTATLTVRDLPSAADMAVFESGDLVRARTFARASGELTITDAWGTVSDYTDGADGLQTWTFTRLATNGGAMSGGTQIPADAIVLDYGVAGNGWYEVSAVDGAYGLNAPYAQVVTWEGDSPADTSTLRARFGNLRGVTSVDDEFGLLAGTYAATGGQYFRASNEAFELHGVNLSLWNGSTEVIRLDRTAPSFALGATLPSGYASGTGVWMGIDSGAAKFRVGAPSGAGFFWDGTTATFVGVGTGLTEIDGGNIQTESILAASIAADTITASQIAADAITTSELNADSVTSAKIAAGTIVAADIAAGTITATEIAAGTITATQIASGTITGTQIAAGSIVASDIATGTITATQIAAGTITTQKIGSGEVRADNIQAGTITADKLNVSTLSAIAANLGTVTAGTITVGSSNKLWLNPGGSTVFAIGGSSLGSAPVSFNFAGTVVNLSNVFVSGDLELEGNVDITNFAGGGQRFVCVTNGGTLFAQAFACDAGPEAIAAAPSADVRALRVEVDALKARLAASEGAVLSELRAMNRDLAIVLRGGGR